MTPPLRPSANTRLGQNVLGQSLSMQRPRGWRHPWFTEAKWMDKQKEWKAFVVAGFVNGVAPVVRTTAGEMREARGAFYGQLVDARSGAAEIEQLARLSLAEDDDAWLQDGDALDVPLHQNPPVGLHEWRNIGWDGAAAVPLFFQHRGVNRPPPGIAAQLERGRVSQATFSPPKGNRLLRACDIFLHQPRTALTSSIDVTADGILSGVSNVTQTLGFREAAPNDKLKIQSGTYSAFQQNQLNFRGASNAMASDYEEKNWDEAPVSTVYLMSPADAPLDAKPDATWQAFAKHHLFWNLCWAQPAVKPVFNTDIFRGITGLVGVLAGGAGIGAVNFITASINDATQGAFNILQSQSLAGSFWTPTGGGTTSAMPEKPGAAASGGLDKAAAARAKAREARAKKLNARLDPEFPYEGQKFNTSLL